MTTKVKTYLVSGGLGHIGSSLINNLLLNGNRIILVDDLSTQRFPALFGKFHNDKFHFINDTLQSKIVAGEIKKVLTNTSGSLDAVIHLAAQTDAASSFDREAELKKNNFEATCAAVDIAIKANCALVYPSSTSVYGENSNLVVETSTVNPQSPYAESKIIEENFVLENANKPVILRLGTIAGPSMGMRFHTAVNSFVWKSIIGQPVTIWTTAFDQKRPYLCLTDALRAFEHSISLSTESNEIYNVLSENSTPRAICKIIEELSGKFEIKFVDSKIMNQLTYEVSAQKFQNTGFEITSNLREAIGDTINFLKNYKQ